MQKLLIANRGEIAVRIARSAHRLGISTVGIYSDSDATALHVDAVDIAVSLGGTTPATSYLRADTVLRAALDTGCDAVHPGYGFLAENADFAQQVIDAGLSWVGPTPEQIRLLGDKVAAKQAAIEAGVPTTSIIEVEGTDVPSDVPMPALVKAAAGGGGRGMRIVRDAAELADAVAAASREAGRRPRASPPASAAAGSTETPEDAGGRRAAGPGWTAHLSFVRASGSFFSGPF